MLVINTGDAGDAGDAGDLVIFFFLHKHCMIILDNIVALKGVWRSKPDTIYRRKIQSIIGGPLKSTSGPSRRLNDSCQSTVLYSHRSLTMLVRHA